MKSVVVESDKWKQQSDEGTAAHWVCEEMLYDCKENGRLVIENLADYSGQIAPNGVVVTDDMLRGARLYLEEIELVAAATNFAHLDIEQHVQTSIHQECAGTPDAGMYDEENKALHIWDYKYGHGDVAAYENWQLLCYYDGVMDSSQSLVPAPEEMDLTVHFHVIQPRCFTANGPVKEWIVPAVDLRANINILKAAAVEAMSGDPKTKSGNHCRHCPARHECASAREAALDAVSYQNTVRPEPLTDKALAFEGLTLGNAMAALKYRKEAIDDEIASRIAAGKSIPHFSVVMGKGHRKWDVDIDTLQMVGEGSGVNLLKDPEGVSPAEAKRRLMKAGLKGKEADATLSALASAPSTGAKVVRDKGTDANMIFSKTTGANV